MKNIAHKLTRGQVLLKEAETKLATTTFFTDFLDIPLDTLIEINHGSRYPSVEEKLLGACEFLKLLHDENKRKALLNLIGDIDHYYSPEMPNLYNLFDYSNKHGV